MKPRLSLARKYLLLLAGLVSLALISGAGMGLWFSHQETLNQLMELQREKAILAATRIDSYIQNIVHQIDWMTAPLAAQAGPGLEERRYDCFKLLRHVPAVSDVRWIDPNGFEQLRVSRLTMDALGQNIDRSGDPAVKAAKSNQNYYGPVYFRNQTEPYLTIARSSGRGAVTIAEINLKFIWDVVSELKVGETGLAYATDSRGILIAHPNIGQVLKKTDMSGLPQVAHALTDKKGSYPSIARNLTGMEVLSANAAIPGLDWNVFVELPTDEAFRPLRAMLLRSLILLLMGILVSVFAAIILARRMAGPIRLLTEGAGRIGEGFLDQRIEVHTGDELEVLAMQMNDMAKNLNESYATLERKVEERTAELKAEQAKSRNLLTNILPERVINELSETGQVKPTRHEEVTVLFADLVNFTAASATMPASRMVGELNDIFEVFDEIVQGEGIEKIKTIGDAYMAAAGLSDDTKDDANRCARAALKMVSHLLDRNSLSAFKWQVRIGIHSGPVVSGVVGKHKYAFDIWGDTVNLASRLQSAGEEGRINVSGYTCDLIREEFDCAYRGKLTAKGKGEIDMYFVNGLKT